MIQDQFYSAMSVVILGQSLPFDDLVKLSDRYRPHFVVTYFTAGLQKMTVTDYLQRLAAQVNADAFLLCGPKAIGLAPKPADERFVFLETVNDLRRHLDGENPV